MLRLLPATFALFTTPLPNIYSNATYWPRLTIFSHDETDIHPLWKRGGEQDHGDGSLQ